MTEPSSERQLVLTCSAWRDVRYAERQRRDEENTHCARCGEAFTCGAVGGHARCWCFDLPSLPAPVVTATSCYCPNCLRILTSAQGGNTGPR